MNRLAVQDGSHSPPTTLHAPTPQQRHLISETTRADPPLTAVSLQLAAFCRTCLITLAPPMAASVIANPKISHTYSSSYPRRNLSILLRYLYSLKISRTTVRFLSSSAHSPQQQRPSNAHRLPAYRRCYHVAGRTTSPTASLIPTMFAYSTPP